MKKLIFVFSITIFLFSCGNSKKGYIINKIDENGKATKELIDKYNAVSGWDTVAAYTSYYQKEFIEQKKLMFFKGRIYDIIKEDSIYIVKVLDEREDAYQNFLALITFTPQELESKYPSQTSPKGVFIIKVSKITTSNPSIKTDEEGGGEDASYTYTHLSDDKDQMITIFKGKIVDCYFEKDIEDK